MTQKDLIESVLNDESIDERFKKVEREKIKICNQCPDKNKCWNCGV